jgi:hypothetical protein
VGMLAASVVIIIYAPKENPAAIRVSFQKLFFPYET